jgi:hypothetical protein
LVTRVPSDVELPSGTTVVAFEQTRVSPGDVRVRVVAIEPGTFADAVSWPEEFGLPVEDVVAAVTSSGDRQIPAVALTGEAVPTEGSFGLGQGFPYRVVGRVESVPLATDFGATLLVSAESVDRWELERIADSLGLPSTDPAVLDRYRPPTVRYRHQLVSTMAPDDLQSFASMLGLRWRSVSTSGERSTEVDIVAPRLSFDYLGLLGWVSAVASMASLMLYLSGSRRRRALVAVMTRRMGMSRHRSALVTVVEVMLLTAVASVTAVLAAPLLVHRLLPSFDPAPSLPPAPAVDVPASFLVAAVVGVVIVVGLVVWVAEIRWSRRDQGSVLRAVD